MHKYNNVDLTDSVDVAEHKMPDNITRLTERSYTNTSTNYMNEINQIDEQIKENAVELDKTIKDIVGLDATAYTDLSVDTSFVRDDAKPLRLKPIMNSNTQTNYYNALKTNEKTNNVINKAEENIRETRDSFDIESPKKAEFNFENPTPIRFDDFNEPKKETSIIEPSIVMKKEEHFEPIKEVKEEKKEIASDIRPYEVPKVALDYPKEEKKEEVKEESVELTKEDKDTLVKSIEEALAKLNDTKVMTEPAPKEEKKEVVHKKETKTKSTSKKSSNQPEDMDSVKKMYSDSEEALKKQDHSLDEVNKNLASAEEAKKRAEEKKRELMKKLIEKTEEIQKLQEQKAKLEAEQKARLAAVNNETSILDRENDELEAMIRKSDETKKRLSA